ncbi:MAG: cytochrome c oxidase subunit II [Polyangiales bacterium]
MSPMDVVRRMLFLPEQASSAAPGVDLLHFCVIGVTMTGAVAVAAVTTGFLLRYARTRENEPTPHVRTGPWAMVVKIFGPLLLFLAFWVVGFRQYIAIETPPAGAIDVYVTGKQWMWKFAYPSGASSISNLVVPKGRPVRLIMTSRDVIHSFYVPAFRVKQDVLPGRTTTLWFTATRTGTFDIFCAEYCGTSHSGMGGAVTVLEERDFAQWLEHEGGSSSMAARGAGLARDKQCLACHSVDGQKHIGPSFRGLYRSSVLLTDGRTVLADEAYLTRSMMLPAADVHAGFTPVMPTYEGRLDADEVGALVEYIKSLRDEGPKQVITLPEVSK